MNKSIAVSLAVRVFATSVMVVISTDSFAQSDYRTVFVKNSQICLTGTTKVIRCLTDDNRNKSLPVWSLDGSKIAYVETGENSSALAVLHVIDRNGCAIAKIPVKAKNPGEIRSGMRYVESIEWISSNRLAVSGSVNPSSREYVIIDVSAQQVVDEFVSDEYRAGFSADGLSYAAVAGAPHFTPRESRAPALLVNGRRLEGLVPSGIEIAGPPIWAPDGSAIAIPLRYATSRAGADSVMVWERGSGTKHLITAPSRVRDIRWKDNELLATSMPENGGPGSQGWQLPIVTRPFSISGWQPVIDPTILNSGQRDEKLRTELRDALVVDGGINIDIWCASCGLSNLPRRVPHEY
jgi:hypothetical protein